MRQSILTAGIGAATVLAAACAGGPMKASLPKGLAFDCVPGGAMFIRFGEGGYLPDGTARGEGARQVPRSTAELDWRGRSQAMVAEWAELGLRYRAETPDADGSVLTWAMRGEEAVLARRAAGRADAGDDVALATCRRRGRDATAGG